jgi:hypothetical protein
MVTRFLSGSALAMWHGGNGAISCDRKTTAGVERSTPFDRLLPVRILIPSTAANNQAWAS